LRADLGVITSEFLFVVGFVQVMAAHVVFEELVPMTSNSLRGFW